MLYRETSTQADLTGTSLATEYSELVSLGGTSAAVVYDDLSETYLRERLGHGVLSDIKYKPRLLPRGLCYLIIADAGERSCNFPPRQSCRGCMSLLLAHVQVYAT